MPHGYSRNLYSEMFNTDKYLQLTPQQRCLWIYLFGGDDTFKSGLLPKRYELMKLQSGLDKAGVDEALALFASDEYGWIHHDEKYILVKDFVEDQSNSANWVAGAIAEAKSLQDKTQLAKYVIDRYGVGMASDAVETPSARRRDAVGTPSKRRSNGVGRRADSVSEAVSEVRASANADDGPAERRPSREQPAKSTPPKLEKPKPYTPEQLELAREMCEVVEELTGLGYTVVNPRTPESFAAGLARSGLPDDELRAAWHWGSCEPFWAKQMCGMGAWHSGQLFKSLKNAWVAAGSPPPPDRGDGLATGAPSGPPISPTPLEGVPLLMSEFQDYPGGEDVVTT